MLVKDINRAISKRYSLEEKIRIGLASPRYMYYFSIEYLELVVSYSRLGEGGCDCTVLAID